MTEFVDFLVAIFILLFYITFMTTIIMDIRLDSAIKIFGLAFISLVCISFWISFFEKDLGYTIWLL